MSGKMSAEARQLTQRIWQRIPMIAPSGAVHVEPDLKLWAGKSGEIRGAGVGFPDLRNSSRRDYTVYSSADRIDGEKSFPELDAFKVNRAFDDFENRPLHATILIDAQGMVRWQDISHEPFKDIDFLLLESKRLLPLTPGATVVAPTVAGS